MKKTVSEIAQETDKNHLETYLKSVIGVRHHQTNPERLSRTIEILSDHFQKQGFTVAEDSFLHKGDIGVNVIGTLEGRSKPDKIYIVGAHYDTMPDSPGADDNGTGIAGLMEIAAILGKYRFEQTIKLIAFGMEEHDFAGSSNYVRKAYERQEQINGVFIMEMIGYATEKDNTQAIPSGFHFLFPDIAEQISDNSLKGNFVAAVGNSNSRELIKQYQQVAKQVVPGLCTVSINVSETGLRVPDLRRSDHAPFWDRGYPSLMITDTANFRNPNYHAPTDSIDTINFEFAERVVKSLVGTIAYLAGVNAG